MIVYLVTHGEYSDRSNIAAFTTKELADEFAASRRVVDRWGDELNVHPLVVLDHAPTSDLHFIMTGYVYSDGRVLDSPVNDPPSYPGQRASFPVMRTLDLPEYDPTPREHAEVVHKLPQHTWTVVRVSGPDAQHVKSRFKELCVEAWQPTPLPATWGGK